MWAQAGATDEDTNDYINDSKYRSYVGMRLYIHYVQIPSHERQRGGGIQNDGKPNLIRTGLFSREERKPSNNVKRNVNEK